MSGEYYFKGPHMETRTQLEGSLCPIVSRVQGPPPQTTQDRTWAKILKHRNTQFIHTIK